MPTLPSKARVVIIGGGIVGCSVAYHLTKLGWKDVVLLERKQLTSGTTWHAAGLIAQLRATANMTKLAKYSQELYGNLEEETGVATGFKRVGSITAALTGERLEELHRSAAMARAFGVEVEEIRRPKSNNATNISTSTVSQAASTSPLMVRETQPTSPSPSPKARANVAQPCKSASKSLILSKMAAA